MKKVLIIILCMIAFSNKSTSQNLEKLSVEFDADYCYYFKIPNDINYGFALLFRIISVMVLD